MEGRSVASGVDGMLFPVCVLEVDTVVSSTFFVVNFSVLLSVLFVFPAVLAEAVLAWVVCALLVVLLIAVTAWVVCAVTDVDVPLLAAVVLDLAVVFFPAVLGTVVVLIVVFADVVVALVVRSIGVVLTVVGGSKEGKRCFEHRTDI